MMSYVFRLHTGNQLNDWAVSTPIGPNAINTIHNPAGLSPDRQITSIPSPFARIDLVKTAFEQLVKPETPLVGDTMYHRLVSEALDLAEIVFNYERFKNDIEILTWERSEVDRLINAGDARHRLLGNTLDLFLIQDASSYNFSEEEFKRLFIIRYRQHKILGATSPATLFFSTANDVGTINLQLGNHRAFDTNNFTPLFLRDNDFQEYIYHYFAYINSLPDPNKSVDPDSSKPEEPGMFFSNRFDEFTKYLEKSLTELNPVNPNLFSTIQKAKANPNAFSARYKQPVNPSGQANAQMDILGQPYFLSAGVKPGSITETSHLTIKSPNCPIPHKPLVLANGLNTPNLIYFNTTRWNPQIRVPYFDPKPLMERQLPGHEGQNYPYLTISDFLESYLVRLPFSVDSEFSATVLSIDDRSSYLLPLTSRFFEFFKADDLTNGNVKISIQKVPSANQGQPNEKQNITVSLRIPVTQGFVTFERTYEWPKAGQPPFLRPKDTGYQVGELVEWSLTLLVFPFLRTTNATARYRLMMVDGQRTERAEASLSLYRIEDSLIPIKPVRTVQRRKKSNDRDAASTNFLVLQDNFDLVQFNLPFTDQLVQATLLPKWPDPKTNVSRFRVAVDFGTTNTHIEYWSDNGTRGAFELPKDELLKGLHKSEAQTRALGHGRLIDPIVKEFLPARIGKQEPYQLPTRTALNEPVGLNWGTPTDALAHVTLPFYTEREQTSPNSRNVLNLKWSNVIDQSNQLRVARYIETLLLLIRAKILNEGGDLDSTELIWFYPSSMSTNRLALFNKAWDNAFRRLITSKQQPIRLSESLAPFYFYNEQATAQPAVSIDIGGGTTDLVIFVNNEPIALSSFTFAANAIYGDGYTGQPMDNGFIQTFTDPIKEKLKENELSDLQAILDQLTDLNTEFQSSDIVSFFFSLADHTDIRTKNIPLSFADLLAQNTRMKVVPMTFYLSLFYHIARLMQGLGLDSPQFILFSGKGSKLTTILDPDPKLPSLQKLTKLIFDYVYQKSCPSVELKQTANPKEVTSKGGLSDKALAKLKALDLDTIKTVLTGTSTTEVIKGTLTGRTYQEVVGDLAYRNNVVTEVQQIAKLIPVLDRQLRFMDKFGIDTATLQVVIDVLTDERLLVNAYQAGLDERVAEIGQATSEVLNETLFFYPLVGALHEVAKRVA